MAVILHDCASEKERCGSAAHRRPPESGDGMTTGDPTHEKSGRPSKRKRAVCGRQRCCSSTFTQLRPPPVCTGRGIREVWEPPPLLAALLVSTGNPGLRDAFSVASSVHDRLRRSRGTQRFVKIAVYSA